MSSDHPDFEALSAYLDGEAPEWAPHVAGCGACQATVGDLRAVARAVGAPVEPAAAAAREHAVSVAMGGVVELRPAQDPILRAAQHPIPHPARRRGQARWMLPAVAALVLVVAGLSGLAAMSDRSSTERRTLAGPALESGPTADSFAALPQSPLTDLGDVPDAATLLARARPALAAKDAAGSGAASAAAAPTSPGPTPAAGERLGVPAPATPGTRPCEEQARARQPLLGPVVYFATARRQDVPAVVLGFSTGPAPAPVTLLLLAQDGCAEMLRVAVP